MAIPNDTQMNFDFYLGPYSPYTHGGVFDPNVQRAWSASETFLPSYSQMQPPIGQDITATFDNFHFPQSTAPRFAQYMGGVPDWNVMPNIGKLSFDSQAYFSQLPTSSSLDDNTKQIEQGLSSLSFSSNVENEKSGERRQSQQTWASVARPVSKDFTRNQGPQRALDAGAYERRTGGRSNYRVCAPRSSIQSQFTQNNCSSNLTNTLSKTNDLGSTSSTPVNSNDHMVLQKLKRENLYNPTEFNVNLKGARFFVIKSYSEDDVHRSIKYKIWCSTEHGNKKLDSAFREREGKGPIYLFFSVNGSGHFCGVAEMMSPLDYDSKSDIWSQDKWRGKFDVKWIYVKDVPNVQLRNIRLENNENKPVTNSRDTQEVPVDKGKQMLRIIHHYKHSTSIFDDFDHYEKRQREDKKHKKQIHNQHSSQSSTLSQTNRPQ